MRETRLVSRRQSTRELSVPQRLAMRGTHARELLVWMDAILTLADNNAWPRFPQDQAPLHQVFGESDDPPLRCGPLRELSLLGQCMAKTPGKMGRTVRKNDFEREHQQARAKALQAGWGHHC